MLLDLVIPSLGRIDKLTATLNSIFLSSRDIPINLYIYFSDMVEWNHFQRQLCHIPEIHLALIDNYRVPNFWNAHLQKMVADMMIYLNDDVLLYNNTLELVINKFEELGTDIVLGLSQSNLPEDQGLPGAFGIIGSKYADRFPNRQVFCPDYDRFHGDWELMQHAKSIGRFHFDRDIKIEHLHPAFGGKEDQTHRDVRRYLSKDKETFRQRQSKGFLWGNNFNLINHTL